MPGDCLLYWTDSFFDWLVTIKTWTFVAHVEIYKGLGLSMASRNGLGVNTYPLRKKGLVMVRRPNPLYGMYNASLGGSWFETVRGEKYDWLGLLCFTLAVKQGAQDKMFCSEFAKRYYPKAGVTVLADDWDADKTAPAQLVQTPALTTIWRHPRLN